MKLKLIACAALAAGFTLADAAEALRVESPNGEIRFDLKEGFKFSIARKGKAVIEESQIAVTLDGKSLTEGATFGEVKRFEKRETYPFRGAHSVATNHFNGASLEVKNTAGAMRLEVRVFNDGAAFRQIIPAAGEAARTPDEGTTFAIPDGSRVWHHDLGGHYEEIHTNSAVASIVKDVWIAPPMTFALASGGYASITEANLRNYSGMALRAEGGRRFSVGLGHKHPISYPYRLRYSNDIDRVTAPAAISGAITSAWRVVTIAADLNGLVNSDIVANLADAPDATLFPEGQGAAWIKPGRAVWKYLDGGANSFEDMKRFSAWAGELGFEHHVIEGFWSRWSDEQVKELVEFSRAKGVSIWLWRHSRELRTAERQEEFFSRLARLGVAGAKIDFFDHEHREVVGLYEQLLAGAARHKILINFHGSNKPTGEGRTFPNELTREGVRGMESSRLRERARHGATLPFTRLLAGPADYTPVHFGARRADTTDAHQIATAAIFGGPLLTYAAHPTNLLQHVALPLIKSIPAVWDETRVLAPSKIGELAAFARRSGNVWHLVVLNGPAEQTVTVPLDFLARGKGGALVLSDAAEGPSATLEQRELTGPLELKLRAGGGFVARFE